MVHPKTTGSLISRFRAGFAGVDGVDLYLTRNLSMTFFVNVAGKGMTFVTGVLLARLMGPSNLGVYAMALAVAQLLRLPSALGLPGVVARYVPVYEVEENWGLLRGLLLRAVQLTLSLSVVATITGSIVVWFLNGWLEHEKAVSLWLALAMIPIFDFSVLRSAALQGLRRVVFAQIPDILLRPMLLIVFLGVAWSLTATALFVPVFTLALYLLAVIFSFILGMVLLMRAIPQPTWQTVTQTDYRRWGKSLLPFMLLYTMQLVLSQVDIVMLSLLSTDTAVGLYRVASQGAELMSFTLGIVNVVIQPMIARLHTLGDHARLQQMITHTTRLSVAVTLPLALLLVSFGPWLLSTVFGAPYRLSYAPMTILAGGQLFNVAVGSVGLLLFMTGNERDAARAISLAVVLNVALDFALIPDFGTEGAAIASTASLIAWNMFLFNRVRQRLGLHPTVFGAHL
jgi:O-antigen/teichoic acid export membrane protein